MDDWRVPKSLLDLLARETHFLGELDGEVGLLAPPTTLLGPMLSCSQ